MKIGVIGLGSIGQRHIRNIQKLYPRASIDILTKRKSWDGLHASTRLMSSQSAFFNTPHDVYFITNETVKHTATLLRVLKQKPKGIFVEKPLSHSLIGLAHIRNRAKRQGIVIFVGYNLQFFKPLLKLKELLTEKVIGKVRYMRVSVGQDLRVWRTGDYRTQYSADAQAGGGVVLDLIHDLNYPAWLIDEPLSFLVGYVGTISLPISAEDVAESIFRSPSGVVVSVHQDYLQNPGGRYCEIVGTKGMIIWEWPLGGISTIRVDTPPKRRTIRIAEDRNRMYTNELAWFMKKVMEGRGYTNLDEAVADVSNAQKIKKHSL